MNNINYNVPPVYEPLRREWVSAHNHGDATLESEPFTIVSYNTLAYSQQMKHQDLYYDSHPINFDWNVRRMALIAEIFLQNADIYCLQEVDEEWYRAELRSIFLKMGFNGFFQKRPIHNQGDGSCIFWRNSRFDLEPYGYARIEFNAIEGNKFLDRPNEALVVILRDYSLPSPQPRVCVATTHLLWNPKRGITKLGQLDALFTKIRQMTEKYDETMPIIFCGDLNSTPGSMVDHFIQHGSVDMGVFDEEYFSGQVSLPDHERALQRAITKPSKSLSPSASTNPLPLANLEAIYSLRNMLPQTTFIPCKTPPLDPILRHPFRLQSAYKYSRDSFTTFHGDCKSAVDFIYFGSVREDQTSKTHRSSTLRLDATLKLPGRSLIDMGISSMPDLTAGIASDHLVVAAQFRFVELGEGREEL